MSRHSRTKRQGHYCWVCGRERANERFTGEGHRQHICKDCQRRPKAERDGTLADIGLDIELARLEEQAAILCGPTEGLPWALEEVPTPGCEAVDWDEEIGTAITSQQMLDPSEAWGWDDECGTGIPAWVLTLGPEGRQWEPGAANDDAERRYDEDIPF